MHGRLWQRFVGNIVLGGVSVRGGSVSMDMSMFLVSEAGSMDVCWTCL